VCQNPFRQVQHSVLCFRPCPWFDYKNATHESQETVRVESLCCSVIWLW
jgi:hypothetical protein